MKFFDELLRTATEQKKPVPKEITMGKILDGDITFSDKDGGVRDEHGRLLGKLSMDISGDLEPIWRLKIPASKWDRVDIICDGNALDVDTKSIGNDRYIVKRTVRGFKPVAVVVEDELELRKFGATKDFVNWIEGLDTDMVEALRQIYYDRWCFDTANQRDRMYYELLEEEKKGRT